MNPYASGTELARKVIHSNETLAILATEIGNAAAVMGMLSGIRADRNLLIRADHRAKDRRFTGEPLTGWGAL